MRLTDVLGWVQVPTGWQAIMIPNWKILATRLEGSCKHLGEIRPPDWFLAAAAILLVYIPGENICVPERRCP